MRSKVNLASLVPCPSAGICSCINHESRADILLVVANMHRHQLPLFTCIIVRLTSVGGNPWDIIERYMGVQVGRGRPNFYQP